MAAWPTTQLELPCLQVAQQGVHGAHSRASHACTPPCKWAALQPVASTYQRLILQQLHSIHRRGHKSVGGGQAGPFENRKRLGRAAIGACSQSHIGGACTCQRCGLN